ncbi:SAM-dependent methyltransferase [Dermatobacter hominis]|uniref:SAM-dependent methyltransferase n=1 Tax=Dermatobacter hominis TaxID=2884263 RepID=UPI001D1264A5|nr:SAM-dependent methyltransferase [Dermatobacter hominis]UDY33910.1 SAM-dependent methyltransferase [Dermatobacter hominis]
MSEGGAAEALAERIARQGSVRFDEFVTAALYDPDGGFFSRLGDGGRGRAGRAGGDFITSPEVGPLFGAVLARHLDARWEDLGRPDPFVVVEAGAGRGALAISVLAAAPACAPALRYVLVERSAVLRRAQAEHLALSHPFEVLGPPGDADEGVPSPVAGSGPLVCSLPDLPAEAVDGVVVANELLDNVPFRLFERAPVGDEGDGWLEVRVTVDAGRFVELAVPADPDVAERLEALAPDARPGARVPLQDAAAAWLRAALAVLRTGSVLLFDYAATTTASLADRPVEEWLRTYRDHDRGTAPLDRPGSQDVTVEVAVDQLAAVAAPDDDRSQDEWLRRWGIQGMVEEGRRLWEERAGVGDLAALRARSRAVEAEALCDPTGLGAFRALEWRVPPAR